MRLFSSSSACRAEFLQQSPEPAAGIERVPRDFSVLRVKDSATDRRSWKEQAAACRNKLESGRTDVLSLAMCEAREALLVFVMEVSAITFLQILHSYKFVREIHLQDRSEMPRSLWIVKHQMNLSTVWRSGKLEIKKKKRKKKEECLARFLQNQWSKWCCSYGIFDLSATKSTFVLCVLFILLFGTRKFAMFKKEVHIFIFNGNSSLDVLGSDPVTLLAAFFTPISEANALLVLMKPIRLLTQVGPRYVNQYCKMWSRVWKWKTLGPIGRLRVWFSSQLH